MGSFLLRDATILTVDASDVRFSEGWTPGVGPIPGGQSLSRACKVVW